MKPSELVTDLDEVLSYASTPEFRGMACEAASFIYETQVEEFAFRLQNVISESSDSENEEIIANVDFVLRDCLNDFLLDHRITVSQDASLFMITKVAKAVLELPFWLEKDSVIDICMEDAPAIDRLASLVKLVCGGEVTTIAMVFENVDVSFLNRLIKLVDNDVQDLDETVLDDKQVLKLQLFKQKFGKCFALQMVELGWRIGSPIATYLNRAQTRLVQLNNQEMAKELVAFLYMGSDTWFDPLAKWSDCSGALQLDLNVHAQVTIEIRKILQQINSPELDTRSTKGLPQ